MSKLVAIVAYDRLCTFEFGCAIEVFALPRPELDVDVGWYRHAVCAAEPGEIRGLGGVNVRSRYGLGTIRRADIVIIPGWRDPDERPPEGLLRALRTASGTGATIASICSGVFVLAHAGLLDGRRATTHWRHAERLARSFPDIDVDSDVLYVESGNIVTAAGSAAGLDMMIHLVRRDFGTSIANSVARRLVIAPHRDGGQAQFAPRPVPPTDNSPIAGLIERIRTAPGADHSIAAMSQSVHMSRRSFHRRFSEATGTSPMEWLIRERVAYAKDLLVSNTEMSIDDIAAQAGFGSAESLRYHFREHKLPNPTQFRRLNADAQSTNR